MKTTTNELLYYLHRKGYKMVYLYPADWLGIGNEATIMAGSGSFIGTLIKGTDIWEISPLAPPPLVCNSQISTTQQPLTYDELDMICMNRGLLSAKRYSFLNK
ncbi:hypothetical protein [Pantoea sp.]|uniref:hypothetical protein n=1 Tax=Pantoea sp. TaxID=69393 RepID=UPI0031E35C3B